MLSKEELKLMKAHAHFSMQQSDMLIQLAETAERLTNSLEESDAIVNQLSAELNHLHERLDQDEAAIQHKDMQLSHAAKTINGLNAEAESLKKQVEELKVTLDAVGVKVKPKESIGDEDLPWEPDEIATMSHPKSPPMAPPYASRGPVDPPMGG